MDGFWDICYWLVYRGDLLSQVAVSTGFTVIQTISDPSHLAPFFITINPNVLVSVMCINPCFVSVNQIVSVIPS